MHTYHDPRPPAGPARCGPGQGRQCRGRPGVRWHRAYDAGARAGGRGELYDMHLIFIPIILRDHWSLVTVDMREMRIDFYDPSGGDGTRICEAIRLWLCDMHQGLRTVRAGRPPPPKPRRLPRRAADRWLQNWHAPVDTRHPNADGGYQAPECRRPGAGGGRRDAGVRAGTAAPKC